MSRAGRGSDQFALRMPDGLRDRVKELADENGRSMNSELVKIIKDAVARSQPQMKEGAARS